MNMQIDNTVYEAATELAIELSQLIESNGGKITKKDKCQNRAQKLLHRIMSSVDHVTKDFTEILIENKIAYLLGFGRNGRISGVTFYSVEY